MKPFISTVILHLPLIHEKHSLQMLVWICTQIAGFTTKKTQPAQVKCEQVNKLIRHNLTHCILNRFSHTIYWKSPVSILGTSGYEI